MIDEEGRDLRRRKGKYSPTIRRVANLAGGGELSNVNLGRATKNWRAENPGIDVIGIPMSFFTEKGADMYEKPWARQLTYCELWTLAKNLAELSERNIDLSFPASGDGAVLYWGAKSWPVRPGFEEQDIQEILETIRMELTPPRPKPTAYHTCAAGMLFDIYSNGFWFMPDFTGETNKANRMQDSYRTCPFCNEERVRMSDVDEKDAS